MKMPEQAVNMNMPSWDMTLGRKQGEYFYKNSTFNFLTLLMLIHVMSKWQNILLITFRFQG